MRTLFEKSNWYGGTTAIDGRKRIFITGKAMLPAPEELTGARPRGCPQRYPYKRGGVLSVALGRSLAA
ncbi:hypothetical protein AV530_019502 [Patagioenas fasciata monilis]|uniref:Uncharacterized protein n=1 Tax=Patagioenas fasciata monilis TaxID=372326 RepID=A0A1V4JDK3_PATFA|nr:hypothetical protein AV530_019502 [Patagioenas fasciata monilis]